LYLQKNVDPAKLNTNIFSNSADLFSLPQVFDIYCCNNNSGLGIVNVQTYLNLNTLGSIQNLLNLAQYDYLFNALNIPFLELINLNLIRWVNSNYVLDLGNIITNIVHISRIKNDADTMRWVLFDYKDDIELFEVMSNDESNLVYETLSSPDFKLYYPEPFIASPSFVHEDVWYIHILHYNYWL